MKSTQRGREGSSEAELWVPRCQRGQARGLPGGQDLLETEFCLRNMVMRGGKKKISIKKKNQNGPNHILELPYIRKSFPDIFTTNSDPLSLEHRDYNWQSVTYPLTPASNGR